MNLRSLLWVVPIALGVGATLLGAGAAAIFTKQAANSGSTFTTSACFTGDTGLLSPTAQAADSGGDGNGFELNPTNAFADGGGYAENQNGAGDRHRYYNYGMNVASGCAIAGIEGR